MWIVIYFKGQVDKRHKAAQAVHLFHMQIHLRAYKISLGIHIWLLMIHIVQNILSMHLRPFYTHLSSSNLGLSFEDNINQNTDPDSVNTILFSNICLEGPCWVWSFLKLLSGCCRTWWAEVWLRWTKARGKAHRETQTSQWGVTFKEVSAGSSTYFFLPVMLPLLKMLCCDSLFKGPQLYSANFMLHSLQDKKKKKEKKISFHTCPRVLV